MKSDDSNMEVDITCYSASGMVPLLTTSVRHFYRHRQKSLYMKLFVIYRYSQAGTFLPCFHGFFLAFTASSLLSGQSFYWRGFVSDRGSATRPRAGRGRGGPSSNRGGTSRRDSQLQRPSPYSRPERGGRGRGRGAP